MMDIPSGSGAGDRTISPALPRTLRRAGLSPNVRGASVLVVFESRPGRSGLSLHRTGMMVMLHTLRGRILTGGLFFSFRPRLGPENALLSGLFLALRRARTAPAGRGPPVQGCPRDRRGQLLLGRPDGKDPKTHA